MNCIPKHLVNELRRRFKSGEITPTKLKDMGSKGRNAYFSSFLGEANATHINALFESKMLLKAQEKGILNWAKTVTGAKKPVSKEIVSRVNKMASILTPENEGAFYEDLIKMRLGVTVTPAEAANLTALSKDVVSLKKDAVEVTSAQGYDQATETFDQYNKRVAYGRALVAFNKYYGDLLEETRRQKLAEYVKPSNWGKVAADSVGFAKSVAASLDNSVIGRQGFFTLITKPKIWAKNSIQSFVDIAKVLKGGSVVDEVMADVLSRENALNGKYKEYNLAVGVKEEFFPSSLPEKIPVIGRGFKASQEAFTAWQYRTRADIFDLLIKDFEKVGGEKNSEGLGEMINSMTGRSGLGRYERVAEAINAPFFSLRFLTSQYNKATAHIFDPTMSWDVKKIAMTNLARVVVVIASIMAIAKAFDDDSVELDPRSTDFGKIKIGNTRFDITGGMASLYTLAARVFTKSTKSATTKTITELNKKEWGSRNIFDVLTDFGRGKLSPMFSAMVDIVSGETFTGEKVTLGSTAENILTPLILRNAAESINEPDAAPLLATMIADFLGVGTNTYSFKDNWEQKETEEMKQFSAKVGKEKFQEANDMFNAEVNSLLKDLFEMGLHKSLGNEELKDMISKRKKELKKKVFKKYNFKKKEK